ncbi:hypothetical protein HOD08_05300, partial [bacterium]|nr:hypothetical protein [bacterium]
PPKSTKSQVVHDSFEFGSVIKMFTALAALEEGVVDPETVIDCGGASAVVNKTRIENWRPLGVLPFRDVIRRSSNVGVAKTALKLGAKLYDHFDKLGFGKKTGLNFPGERTGFLNASKKWSRSSPLVMSYGYELSSTLLQLGKATCIIANGGHSVEPRLMLDDWVYENRGERLYSEKAVAQTKEILEGIGKRYPIDGFKVFGKTGTARCLRNKRYSKNDHVFSFSGAIEQGEYSRVVVTFIKEAKKVEHWMTAAQIAGPLFQRIAQRMVLLDKMRGVI